MKTVILTDRATLLSAGLCLGFACPVRASSTASADNQLSVSLAAGASTQLLWNADPARMYLGASAYVDFPNVNIGGTYTQDVQAYTPAGTGYVQTLPISEGGIASVGLVSARWLPAGLEMQIGQPGGPGGALSSIGPPDEGPVFADGRSELSNVFRLTAVGPNPPAQGSVAFTLNGMLNLAGVDLPVGGRAETLLTLDIYDLTAGPGAAPLYSWSRYESVAGPGSGSLSTPLGFSSGAISLPFDHDLLLSVVDDTETSTPIPEPATLALLALCLACLACRRPAVATAAWA